MSFNLQLTKFFENELFNILSYLSKNNPGNEGNILMNLFSSFDFKRNGKIPLDSWKEAIKRLGLNNLNDRDLTNLFYIYDVNNMNCIDYEQFIQYILLSRNKILQNNSQKFNDDYQVFYQKVNSNNGVTFFNLLSKLLSKQNNSVLQIISLDNIINAFNETGIDVDKEFLKNLFYRLDNQRKGYININDFINLFNNKTLSEDRKILIVDEFSKMDLERNGSVDIQLVKSTFNPKGHPDVIIGRRSELEIQNEFIFTFDIFLKYKGLSSKITYQEFLEYYTFISASIKDDNYFYDIMEGVWSNNQNINYNNQNMNYQNNQNQNYQNINYNNQNINYNNQNMNYQNNQNMNYQNINYNNQNMNYHNINNNNINNQNITTTQNINNINSQYQNITNEKIIKKFPNNNLSIESKYMKIQTPYNNYRNQEMNIQNNININIQNQTPNIKQNQYQKLTKDNLENINSQMTIDIREIDPKKRPCKDNPQYPIIALRSLLVSKGLNSIFDFENKLAQSDVYNTGKIDKKTFEQIISTFNFPHTEECIDVLFSIFDYKNTGFMDYDFLIRALSGNMNERRFYFVKKLFYSLSPDGNGNININVLKKIFNCTKHPDVISRKRRCEDIFKEFFDSVDYFKNYRKSRDMETLTYEEFLYFYTQVSISFKNDDDFESINLSFWNLK